MRELGFIKLHRQLSSSVLWPAFGNRAFTRLEAWLDLLFQAMHTDHKMMVDGKYEIVRRGSFVTAQRVLSTRWKWGRLKVSRYLKWLESEGMIALHPFTKNTKNGTTLFITNYEAFQGNSSLKCATSDTTNSATNDATDSTTDDTNKKNEKNEEEIIYRESVSKVPVEKKVSSKGKRKRPVTDAPDTLPITDALAQWAKDRYGIHNRQWLEGEMEKCLGHYKAKGLQQADWEQVFRNWINKAATNGWVKSDALIPSGGDGEPTHYPVGHPLHNWQTQYQSQQHKETL